MLKLGEYREDEAKPLIQSLKDEGFKIEVKTFIDASTDQMAFLEGKMSVLKTKVEEFEEYERYLGALKAAVVGDVTEENFRDHFLTGLDPSWMEKKAVLDEICEIDPEPSGENAKKMDEALKIMVEGIVAFDFVRNAMILNDIKFGEDIGEKLDDPLLRIIVDPDEYDEDDELLKSSMELDLEKMYVVYVDDFSTPLFRDVAKGFQDTYSDEYMKILSLGLVIENLIEEPSVGKMDMEAFKERCLLELGEGDEVEMTVDGRDASDEIARVLEKKGVIKIKGDTIKWKI